MMIADPSRSHRFAVYFSPPPGAAWWEAGSRWLGRDAAALKPTPLEQPRFDGLAPELMQQLTRDPARYGWHATLKAPFQLGEGVVLGDLRRALRDLAASFSAFAMPGLSVKQLGDFLALCPQGDLTAINAVASACVTQLHRLAAPLTSAELERRRKNSLSALEDELLQRWGYPYVLERYCFHMSLTGKLQGVDDITTKRLLHAAQSWFEVLEPCRFEGLSLFCEPVKGSDFVLVERWEFAQ